MADLISDGVSVEELSGPIYEKFNKSFTAFKEGFIKLQPYNQIVPRCFLKYEKRIKDFQTRPDDVWVASFPKCGKFYIKVHIFGEGHKILRNLPLTFDCSQK